MGIRNDNVGLIRLYPMNKKSMIDELNISVKKYKYKINSNCINFIADLFEGNMVSANQALIKIDSMINNNDEINLVDLFNTIWEGKWKIVVIMISISC